MIDIISPMIKQFLPFAQKKMVFNDPPKLFLKNDTKNANNPLGKTAFYNPKKKSITLYITGRHPKDVMRSLSHELVHHTQNCRGEFDNAGDMDEGYAQQDEHLREMEREAYEVGNMCFRDWEDSIKETIYFEHLKKGEQKMSTKDWKNKELTTILSEAFGFKFNLDALNEGADKNTGMSGVKGDDDDDTEMGHMKEEEIDENNDQVFVPNHYCVHHGGVTHNGSVQMAEAVGHNWNEELGKVTSYDMKLEDGTILESVSVEEIHVTNASLAEGHGSHPAKRDTGASAGDDSKTHKGEKDYTTKKDDELKHSAKGRGEKKGDKAYVNEDEDVTESDEIVAEESGEEEGRHYDDDRMSDDDRIDAIERHLHALRRDRDYDDQHIDEKAGANRQGNEDKDVGHGRMSDDRVHEEVDSLREAIRAVLSKHLKG